MDNLRQNIDGRIDQLVRHIERLKGRIETQIAWRDDLQERLARLTAQITKADERIADREQELRISTEILTNQHGRLKDLFGADGTLPQ